VRRRTSLIIRPLIPSYQQIKIPSGGEKIKVNKDFSLSVPDNPIIPYIEGDGTGVDITPVTLEEDVRAVLTKVGLGEVDAGLVYRTDVIAAGEAVTGISFPEADEAVNDYPIALLANAPAPGPAEDWIDFVLSETGAAALTEAGFGTP
jgi:ABC-type molybdate transport system substrate-binding protein